MNRAIVTVLGKDRVGIIAKVCDYLAKNNINVLDISQTIVKEMFHMMMIVDVKKCKKKMEVLATEMNKLGDDLGMQIKIQSEEIFDTMHRI